MENIKFKQLHVFQVHYAGVSMKDVKHAVGQEKGDGESFGMDFSGLNNK